jgi:predicted membrane protein
MSDNIQYPKNPNNGRAVAGIILLFVGAMLLLRQFDYFFIPHWLFSWPMWLIGWGIYTGAKHNFKNPSWIILLLIGVTFLINNNVEDSGRVVWPVVIILAGVWLILRKNQRWDRKNMHNWEDKWNAGLYKNGNPFNPVPAADAPKTETADASSTGPAPGNIPPAGSYTNGPMTGDDYLDAVSIFGGVNKTILSKKFKGGEIVNIFGGTELDFTQADINGRVIIDVTQIFGGTKIIVPSNWHVVSDIAALFAGVDDKRIKSGMLDDNKILVLKGISVFAGIDIRSY